MKRKLALATTTAAVLVAAGGASAAAFADSGGHGTTAQKSSLQLRGNDGHSGNEDAREAKAAKTTAPEAAAAAQKAVKGTVTSIDLDEDREGLVWEVDITKGGPQGTTQYDVVLDAGTNKVLSHHKDHDQDEDAAPSGIGAVEAAKKASGAGYGKVTSVDVDDDHGKKPAWEVETTDKQGKEHDLSVDPHSGKVTQLPSDDDRDDAGDD